MSKTISSLSLALLMLILFLLPAQSLARDIYVSNTHSGASDNNPGNQNQPLSSISEALQRAQPGDSVLVGAGTYRESLEFPRSGQQGRPITVKALEDQEVFILGSRQVQTWSPAQDQIWVRQGWETNSQQVFYNDQPLEQIGQASPLHSMSINQEPILQASGSGLSDMYPGSFWYDQDLGALYVWLPDGSSPEDHVMEASVRPQIIASQDVDHIRLQGLIFAHSNTSVLGQDSSMVNIQGQNWSVEDCEFLYADLGALGLQGQGHTVADSSFILHGSHGISINNLDLDQEQSSEAGQGTADNITLRGNETSYNNTRDFSFWWRSGGLRAMDNCQDISIQEHIALDNQGAGIWLDDYCQDSSVSRSLLAQNIAGAIAQKSSRLEIQNNIFAHNNFGLGFLSVSESDVQFNTFERNDQAYLALDLGLEDVSLAYNTLQNNLFHQSGSRDLAILAPGYSQQGNASNYNAFASEDQQLSAEWLDEQGQTQSTTSLQELQQLGLEQDSLVLASLWSEEEAGDYVPPAGSRVVNAAYTSDLADELDFYGRVRDPGSPDIGAVENATAVADASESSGSEAELQAMSDTRDSPALSQNQQSAKLETTSKSGKAPPAAPGPPDDEDDRDSQRPVTSVTVTWDDLQEPDPAGYYVLIGTKSGEYERKIDAGSAKSLTVHGLKKDKKYYITAQAYDEDGNLSDYGEEVVFDP